MKRINFTIIIAVVALCFTAYSQTSERKITEQEKQEVEKFADSFMQSYQQTLNLTKVPESFFVSDYKKRNSYSYSINDFDKMLTDDEKFQNYFTLLDLVTLIMITKLDENNYDLKKTFDNSDANKGDNEDEILSKKLRLLFQKYPKAQMFFNEDEKNSSQIKNIGDYRNAAQDFRSFVQEVRQSITAETKIKFSNLLTKYKDKLFELKKSFNCSKDDCEGLPEKTEMFYYEGLPFVLLIAKENGKLKIVKVLPFDD
ncbi:MAG: hypothetical protein ACR2LT_02270 [Pyrinomonadaceae bacterium]